MSRCLKDFKKSGRAFANSPCHDCDRNVKTPSEHNVVYKDECMFSYDTPFSSGGVAVNLSTWQGFGEDFVALDHKRSSNSLYLLQKWKAVAKTPEVCLSCKLPFEARPCSWTREPQA